MKEEKKAGRGTILILYPGGRGKKGKKRLKKEKKRLVSPSCQYRQKREGFNLLLDAGEKDRGRKGGGGECSTVRYIMCTVLGRKGKRREEGCVDLSLITRKRSSERGSPPRGFSSLSHIVRKKGKKRGKGLSEYLRRLMGQKEEEFGKDRGEVRLPIVALRSRRRKEGKRERGSRYLVSPQRGRKAKKKKGRTKNGGQPRRGEEGGGRGKRSMSLLFLATKRGRKGDQAKKKMRRLCAIDVMPGASATMP